MDRKHALLSPSAAHRWLHCTAAPRLEEGMPDKGSTYADEGTLAHAYCAKKLKAMLGLPTDEEDADIERLSEYHTGEMDEHTDTYVSIVSEKWAAARSKTSDAQLLVEVRLDFTKWIPDAFGTADAVIIADGLMEVIDFKYGKGIKVSAEENPQMMIYALGAYEQENFEYDIKDIRCTIVQPRIENLSEYETTVTNLLEWAERELKPKAWEAFSGKGKQEAGQWCQFCKVKSRCRALAVTCVNTQGSAPDPRLISKEEMEGVILPRLATIKTWLTGVEEYALEQAMNGVEYVGYKVVEGRSNRKIVDAEAVKDALSDACYDRAAYLKPEELRGISDLEKLMGKKRFGELCGEYIVKPQGKPTLVPESDKRPTFNAAADDFKDIDF